MMKKGIIIISITIIIASITGFLLIKKEQERKERIAYENSNEYKLKQKGYSEEEVKTITTSFNEEETSLLLELPYHKENMIYVKEDGFQKENLERYLNLSAKHTELEKNKVVALVNDNLDAEHILSIALEPYFIKDYLERYQSYLAKYQDKKSVDIVKEVNSNLDYDYYTNIQDVDLSKDILLIANKYYQLDEDYIPNDLVNVSSKYGIGGQLRKEAANAYSEMCEAALKEGKTLYATSLYRSYDTQAYLFDNYTNQGGLLWALSVSARPGHSEHQTGLAIDIVSPTSNFDNFDATPEYTWLIENAHKYGFILRYKEETEYITGYSYEPWHYRYVGKETAQDIYEKGITFEEYYAYYVK